MLFSFAVMFWQAFTMLWHYREYSLHYFFCNGDIDCNVGTDDRGSGNMRYIYIVTGPV